MLGSLAYYGGPTATHILLIGSPAIDAGSNPNSLTTDQRGFARTSGSATDIGAFERQPSDIDPTLIVTKTADTNDGMCDGDCSLREAITAANASAPDDAIYFAVTGTITMNSLGALPALDSNMKLLGPGANALAVKRDPAAAAFRILTVNSGKTVTISGLTMTNGNAGAGSGGGIYKRPLNRDGK
jgi:CSLREA domain-containing protein